MKRLIITSCVYSVLSYAVIFLFSLFTVSGEGIFPNMVLSYRVMKSLQLFCIWLPAILITAFLVSYSVLFGKSPKVFNRFSKELKKLFKTVAIVAIVGTGLITLTTELFLPMIEKKITYLEKSPQLYEEYVTLAKKYEEEGYYATAFQYAKAAEYIAPTSDELISLTADLSSKLDTIQVRNAIDSEGVFSDPELEFYKSVGNSSSYALLQLAKEKSTEGDWLNAHYYALLAMEAAEEGSANETEAKEFAAEAWNQLSVPTRFDNATAEALFKEKKSAYFKLISGDIVEAYYDFHTLLEKNPSDVDIVHYFSVAEKAMEDQFFFLDEVPESSDLEDRQNLAFSYTNLKKGKSIFYADGLASVYGTGGRIQYIRNLHIYDFDSQGNCVQSLRVPYAKIMAQPIETLSEKQQSDLLAAGLNKKSDVPLVMLKAVDRSNRGVISEPEWLRSTGDTSDTMVMLPIDFKDFLLLKNISFDPTEMPLADIVRLLPKVEDFGYAQETFGLTVGFRLTTPFIFVVLCIFVATLGWNYRLLPDSHFRLSWLFVFPVLTVGVYVMLEAINYAMRLLHYGLFSLLGIFALPVAILCTLLCLILASLSFLSRKSE